MPESVKYYPVVARILLLLEDKPIVSFRASVISRPGEFVADYRLVHRFIMEYKGATYTCDASNPEYVDFYRCRAEDYLRDTCSKASRYKGKTLEQQVGIEIDLRAVNPTLG